MVRVARFSSRPSLNRARYRARSLVFAGEAARIKLKGLLFPGLH
jgi:hypothetical protein